MSCRVTLKIIVLLLVAIPFSPVARAEAAAVPEGNAADKTVSPGYNRFGIDLFKNIVAGDTSHNVFISPASASMALAMVYNGAQGLTQEEMRKVLELEGFTLDEINQANAELRDRLKTIDSSVELSIANSIWMNQEFPFQQAFLDRTARFFDAAIRSLDFGGPGSVKIINDWVSARTKSRIPGIVDSIHPDDIMFLINAIYFKGLWQHPFDKKLTRERDFTMQGGGKVKASFMERTAKFGYLETKDFQAVSLPYGQGRFKMLIFLPAASYGLNRFLDELTYENWEEQTKALVEYSGLREGTVALPRFKVEYQVVLNRPLTDLGMRTAFLADSANFAGLWVPQQGKNVYISKVKQKTFLEVNEEGSEAAAVTSVEMRVTEVSVDVPPPPFSMIVDRSFFCAIVDKDSGLTLFMGAIVDPR